MCLRLCLVPQRKHLPFVRNFSVKYKVLGSHKPSSADNPKHRKPSLVSNSDITPVRGQSYRTHTREW